MSLREKLPLGIPIETVQTSGLEIQPDPDISGMIVSRRDQIKKLANSTVFITSVECSDGLNNADNRRFWPLETTKSIRWLATAKLREQLLAEANARVDANKRKGELLDTTDPLPLTDFGAIKGVLIGIPLGAFSLALAWGIAKGGVALFTWILIGMEILPLGETW
ncbi:hypothetical protein [Methylophilus sp. Leaf414]|uniref:hypothetical protein n=1 Tax=Methylophilus sp. Leaf414 TaxID=1736371 RepID=UPI0006F4DBFD|nr:hypothetical protein [Methylophilus sp. Leaf414]KQT37703.1 hypothetical protein ASG24_01520 [Methylophilus sp. Leaf414]